MLVKEARGLSEIPGWERFESNEDDAWLWP